MRTEAANYRSYHVPNHHYVMPEKSPCDNCPLKSKCDREKLACVSAYIFVSEGRYLERLPHMQPSKQFFEWMDDDEAA